MTSPPRDIYLNNAATTWPKPERVIDAVQAHLHRLPGESGRSTDELTVDPVQEARETVSEFLGCKEPDHLIFTSGATQSLNMLIHGFAAGQEDMFHVITTDLDHNSVLRPLTTLADNNRIEVSVIPSRDGYIHSSDIISAIRDDTRLFVINQGSNVLGTVQNIHEIHSALKRADLFMIVDGSQTAGQIPVDLSRLGADAFVFTGHKYLFGMPGIGGFWIRDPDVVQPIIQGGTGTNSANLRQPSILPERYEAGTPNYPGIVSLEAGISYLREIGNSRIADHQRKCIDAFYDPLKDSDQIIKYHPTPDIPVFPVNIKGMDPDTAGFVIRTTYGIITRTGLHCAPLIHARITDGKGCVRLSPSILTDPSDCRFAGEVLASLGDQVQSAGTTSKASQ
ncbi:aminotransferase class V-fold PLP-dependent enzyme [Methanospirillum lacunae]|uniref:Aminotransferase class V n=1 Tax=Methanospirillum lacunae TaxID=668570 RepID=A0A2V2MVE7_9EURY|nr:aminotransferase class V-fold PLP-dependent enzyme [Methanospirillum lacunae]PWR71339.1 aminotransferase class V [Methanospirillum lacunae]